MKLHENLIKKFKKYDTQYSTIDIPKTSQSLTVSIASIYHDRTLMYRGECIILGTFSKSKNFWIWSDVSFSLDRGMIKLISELREYFLSMDISDEIKDFLNLNYHIYPIVVIKEYMATLESLSDGYVFIKEYDKKCDFVLIYNPNYDNIY